MKEIIFKIPVNIPLEVIIEAKVTNNLGYKPDFKKYNNISITDTEITMSKIKNQFGRFLMPYNNRNQLPNIKRIITGTVYEFEILGKLSNGDSIASH